MKAKREALEAVWKKQQESQNSDQTEPDKALQDCSPARSDAQEVEGESLQKSLESGVSKGSSSGKVPRKLLKIIGSPHWTHFELLRLNSPAECSLVFFQPSPARPGFTYEVRNLHQGYHHRPEL
jgi:hypothetical protein